MGGDKENDSKEVHRALQQNRRDISGEMTQAAASPIFTHSAQYAQNVVSPGTDNTGHVNSNTYHKPGSMGQI